MANSQARQQEMQAEASIKAQMLNLEAQIEIQRMNLEHEMRREIEIIRAQATLGFKAEEQQFREKLEVLKENRKDDRVKKQAVQQSKLISQRKGNRSELSDENESGQSFMNMFQ